MSIASTLFCPSMCSLGMMFFKMSALVWPRRRCLATLRLCIQLIRFMVGLSAWLCTRQPNILVVLPLSPFLRTKHITTLAFSNALRALGQS